MNVYIRLFLMGWQRNFAARGAMFLYLCIGVLQTLLSVSIWIIASRAGLRVSVTAETLLAYYFYSALLQTLVWSGVSHRIGSEDIKQGRLSLYLLRPFPYILAVLIEELSWRVIRCFMMIPVFLALVYLFYEAVAPKWEWIGIALVFVPACYFLYFLVQSVLGMCAFWFEDIKEQSELVEVFMILFSGAGMPIFFFPDVLQRVSSLLPFQYVLYSPTLIALGKMSWVEMMQYMGMLALWIVVFSVLAANIWRRGLRRYSSDGG